MDRTWVLVQSITVAVLTCSSIIATGHKASLAVSLLAATGLGLYVIGVFWFYARVPRKYWRAWRGPALTGTVAAVMAFLPPLIIGFETARTATRVGERWADNTAAAFAAFCLAVVPAAMLSSSLIDTFVVLPAVLGLRGDALWSKPDEVDNARLRRLAQVWVGHRGISELIIFPAIALLFAIPIVAAGTYFKADPVLPAVFESLGGAGVAFAVFGFARPRWKDAMDFALSAPVGLGAWVRGKDATGKKFQGLIIDVSVHPGFKIITDHNDRIFIPLARGGSLTPAKRLSTKDNAWAREQALTHLLKISATKAAAWPGPPA